MIKRSPGQFLAKARTEVLPATWPTAVAQQPCSHSQKKCINAERLWRNGFGNSKWFHRGLICKSSQKRSTELMKVYEKSSCEVVPGSYFLPANSTWGGTAASLWWRCKVVHTDWAQGVLRGPCTRTRSEPFTCPGRRKKRKKKIELIKKMSCESVVLFEYFSTLYMKEHIFLRDIIISLIISFFPIDQHRFSVQNVSAWRVKCPEMTLSRYGALQTQLIWFWLDLNAC